jgi:hypothetical protein
MNDVAIKKQIIDRMLALLAPLKNDSTVRKIERVTSPWLTEQIRPAIHLVVNPERVIDQDTAGWTMEFSVDVRLIFESQRDPYLKADELEAFIQKEFEGDLQLNQLANHVDYEGDTPYVDEVQKPDGGIFLHYNVQYRRFKANPYARY